MNYNDRLESLLTLSSSLSYFFKNKILMINQSPARFLVPFARELGRSELFMLAIPSLKKIILSHHYHIFYVHINVFL